jgi:hypothetical protein
MVYRGTVLRSVVVLNDPAALADGTPVEVRPRRNGLAGKAAKAGTKSKPAAPSARNRASKTRASKNLPGFGSWRHRKDIGDTAEFVRSLRSGVFERPRRG